MGVFAMPSLGADMEDATLVEWLAQPGDMVARGDVIAVVETQKGAIEIEVFENGPLREVYAAVGDRLPVGAPLALIGERPATTEAAPAPTAPVAVAPVPPTPASPVTSAPAPMPPAAAPESPPSSTIPAARVRASPAARRFAAEHNLDLTKVRGSWGDGAIVLADLQSASKAPPAAKPARPGLDLDAMRAAVAAAMTRSKREIPHFYVRRAIDLQAADDWLMATNAARPVDRRLLMTALFVKATALAVAKAPALNGRYESDPYRPSSSVHVGVAVALRGGGLIAPAIREADALTLDEVMAAMRDMVARARAGRLRSSEMTDGTITVSALGDVGADDMVGVIFPPQCALIGFGSVAPRPMAVDGAVCVRKTATASVAADHRVANGRHAAAFLAELDARLQTPETL